MAEPVISRLRASAVAMKAEATFGTDVFAGVVTAADVLHTRNAEVAPQVENFEAVAHAGFMGSFAGIAEMPAAQVVFEMPLRGRGVAYSATIKPEAGVPFRGCGLSETIVTTLNLETVTYAPRLTGFESMTIYVMAENGITYEIVGAFGDCVLAWVAGQPVVARFTFLGALDAESSVALVRGTPGATPAWPQFKAAAFQIGTENFAARLQNLVMNLGNIVGLVVDQNAARAALGAFISDRAPTGSFDPEMVPSATFPWVTKLRDGVLMDASWQAGATQYNKIVPTVNRVQLTGFAHGERNGKRVLNLPWAMRALAGADEYSILFN